MLQFFKDEENCFSQKRLQIFLAFLVASALAFVFRDAGLCGVFLTYGAVNGIATVADNRNFLERRERGECNGM